MAEQVDSTVPPIRFKGFEGKWEEKALGKLCKEFHSGNFISASKILGRSGYPIYGGNGFRGYSETYNHEGLYALIGRQGALCGNMTLSSGKAFFTEHAVAVRADLHNDTLFLFHLLGRMKLGQYSSQSAQPGLAVNNLQALVSPICEKTEQTQIGGYFKELDGMIGLHQRKHGKLVTLKQAMLQKMFPQNGATTPEIRFKGFSEPWVEKKMEEVSNRYDSLRIPISAVNRITGKTPYYGANGIQGHVKGFTHEGEFILIAEDGANDLKNYPVQYVSGKIWVNNHAHVIQAKSGVADNQFLGRSFSQQDIEQFLVGGGRAKLNANTMMEIDVYLPPNVSEQQKIGTYFRQLDTLISKHATQLEKLKQLKSACLEKMFV